MTNFDFLLSDPQLATFGEVAVAAEKIYAIDPAACVLNCRRCMEFAVKWMYSVDGGLVMPYDDRLASLMDTEDFRSIVDRNLWQRLTYLRQTGSAAAPTAGLHFTKEQMQELREMGVNLGFVTLHVGLGTFRPVSVDNIEEHEMHKEYYCIPDETAKLIMDTKKAGHRVIAVGTTSIRTLESAATAKNEIAGKSGWTGIFIYPGYDFKIVDAIITNFHLPKSTLIMLISAFAGRNFILSAYKTAVEQKYRFFSFGDAMFCSRKQLDAERAEELKELEELDRKREAEAEKKE